MAKIIFRQNDTEFYKDKKPNQVKGFIGEKTISKKRSQKYIAYISNIDTKSLTITQGLEELLQIIQEEFNTAELTSFPLGIVAKCFLGYPYDVHTISVSENTIIRHYKDREAMEVHFEKARTIAKHQAYAFVEVYEDKLVLVREDGTTIQL